MGRDEAGTLLALKARGEDILQPLLVRRSGRIMKLMDDGVLVKFASAVDAVEFAADRRPVS
jgi:class 3 adenylate cyclase